MMRRTSLVIHMSLKAVSPVPLLWCSATASVMHCPVQAALPWRKRRPFRKNIAGRQQVEDDGNNDCMVSTNDPIIVKDGHGERDGHVTCLPREAPSASFASAASHEALKLQACKFPRPLLFRRSASR
ncbi:uncharacterized protein [Dermacentor albipictus]|uniref:uncharacterized protein isoform X3 n=1 Tax=Dermacentor albipictus TaxID=60249 RepID=UPI0031FBEAFE